jgi:hypothetical protein
VSYSFAVAVFGGFTPLINAALIGAFGTYIAPAFYLMAASIVSLIAVVAAGRILKSSRARGPSDGHHPNLNSRAKSVGS